MVGFSNHDDPEFSDRRPLFPLIPSGSFYYNTSNNDDNNNNNNLKIIQLTIAYFWDTLYVHMPGSLTFFVIETPSVLRCYFSPLSKFPLTIPLKLPLS